jgi:hypothetical protein
VRSNSPLASVTSREWLEGTGKKPWRGRDEIKIYVDGVGQEARTQGGFTKADLLNECMNFFKNGASKLTVEFVDTHVMQIQRDIRNLFYVYQNLFNCKK